MDEYAKYVLVLGSFFFFVWWYFRKRQNELTTSLNDILHEIYKEQFATQYWRDEAQNDCIELTNPTMRIRLKQCGATEDLLLERFFANKEACGANIVQTTLHKTGMRRFFIDWKMHHHLMGRTFDIGSGYSFGFQTRQLIKAITQEVRKQALPKE